MCVSILYVSEMTLYRRALGNPINRTVKRIFDITFSSVVLAILAIPVFVPIAIGVRLSSEGPAFFRQKRIGYLGRQFYCIKFRSMYLNNECDTQSATRDDARITPFGRILRRLSLDELPQFWNSASLFSHWLTHKLTQNRKNSVE